MPPKKIIKTPSTEKHPPEKVVKKRVRAVKPKLKIPTVVKVKIPSVPNLVATKAAPKLTKKRLTTQAKIDLANEVARAQLVKSEPVLLEDVVVVKTVGRRRKKQVVSNSFNDGDTTAPAETPEQKNKLNGSKATKELELELKPKSATKKRVTTSTDKPKPAKMPKIIKTNTGITDKCETKKNKNKINCKPLRDLVVTKSKNNVRKSRPRLVKGKLNEADEISRDNANNSPSILKPTVYETVSPCKTITATEQDKPAVSINSRKASVTSTSSISWTKDISSSSTTTCLTVNSNDFVRFDGKIPIISLTNVDESLKMYAPKELVASSSSSSSSSDSGSSSSECRKTSSEIDGSILGVNSQLLNLSASSLSHSNLHDSPRSVTNNNISQIDAALETLSAQLKRFDSEIVNWIGYGNESNNEDVRKIHDDIIEVLKEESDVLIYCRQIKAVLADGSEKCAEDAISRSKSRESVELDVTNANESLDMSNNYFDGDTHFDSDDNDSILETYTKNVTPVCARNEFSSSNSEKFTSDKVKSFDHNIDDDDALSLFAESITGLDSSRVNSSMPSTSSAIFEEYIPELITENPKSMSTDKFIYYPTKIANTADDQLTLNNKNKTICEKQNADSTSIKESESFKSVDKNVFVVPNSQTDVNKDSVRNQPENRPTTNGNTPCLMASRYKRLHGQKSIVFRGICFFYLISSCKNPRCRFPHVELNKSDLKKRLTMLNEELFIQEYMLMRNWPTLRRQYGLCFVEECQRRDLTRILVEMSLDSIKKANATSRDDAVCKVEVIELTLLHLNTVNLYDCQDLLMYKITNGSILCDEYMQVIADTQNFSRFKLVFLNLIQFIIDIGRTFSLSVTEHILERVCILPYEEPLIRAVFNMIRNTDTNILQNSMMRQFEKHIATVGVEFYEQFLEFKKKASLNQRVVIPVVKSPPLLKEMDTVMVMNNTQSEREKRFTSPDTTDLDNLNKVTHEPIITRTINMNPSRLVGFNQSFTPSVTVRGREKEEYRPKNNFHHWRNKSLLTKMLNGLSPQMNRPINRPHFTPPANLQVNLRQVTYKTCPPMFPRGPREDF